MATDLLYAVTDGPDGLMTCVMPARRTEAQALRDGLRTFWCTTAAGGCGGELSVVAGAQRRPHYRHRREQGCSLMNGARQVSDAYHHLAYQRALRDWLASQDYVATIEHTFSDAGGRADLFVSVEGVDHSLEVQLSPLTSERWRERDERYAQHVKLVTWLFGPFCDVAAAADRGQRGVGISIREEEGSVELGVSADGEHVAWSKLGECSMTVDGLWTPHLETKRAEAAAARHAREQRDAEERAAHIRQREESERLEREYERRREATAEHARQEAERRASRTPVPTKPIVALSPGRAYPARGDRTFADWERLYPEAAAVGAVPEWLEGFDPVEQRAGHWMAYVVDRLLFRGLVEDLRHPELSESSFQAVCAALFSAGLAHLESAGQQGRWTRLTADDR